MLSEVTAETVISSNHSIQLSFSVLNAKKATFSPIDSTSVEQKWNFEQRVTKKSVVKTEKNLAKKKKKMDAAFNNFFRPSKQKKISFLVSSLLPFFPFPSIFTLFSTSVSNFC